MPFVIYILLGNWLRSRSGFFGPSGTPKLGRSLLGPGVVHERAGPKLDAGQVFETVAAAMRWIELDVEVGLWPLAAVGRGLVHRHHVRCREPEVAVVGAAHAEEGLRQVHPLARIEIGDRGHVATRVDVHLVGPTGRP